MIVGTHLGSPWGEPSQTSSQRRSVCTWLSHMRNTRWLEFLSRRQAVALDGGEDETRLYVKIVLAVDKVHHL